MERAAAHRRSLSLSERANRGLERVAGGMALAGGLVVVVLMLLMTIDAIGRKSFGAVPGALEFSEALMVGAVFLPQMYVQRHRGHVFVSVATDWLPRRLCSLLDGLAACLGLGIFVLLTWLAMQKAWDAWLLKEYRVAVIAVPIWPFRWLIPLGTGLLCLQLMLTAIDDLREVVRPAGREPASEERKIEESAPAVT
jgi:TRAP-type C4-dicarboxylate transport system permease small subunit